MTALIRNTALLFLVSVSLVAVGPGGASPSTAPSVPFPDPNVLNFVSLDHTAFVGAGQAVLVHREGSDLWALFRIQPTERISSLVIGIAGGSADNPLVVTEKGDQTLQLVDWGANGSPRLVDEQARGQVEGSYCFASSMVGCKWKDGLLYLTEDGGWHWSRPIRPFQEGECVRSVSWLSIEHVIVGGDQGTVVSGTVTKKLIKIVWRSALDGPVGGAQGLSEKEFACFSNRISVLDTVTGKLLDSLPTPDPADEIVAANGQLYLRGLQYLAVISWDGRKLGVPASVPVYAAYAIFPDQKRVKVLARRTNISPPEVFDLNGSNLVNSQMPTVVKRNAPTAPTTRDYYPTQEEQADAIKWSLKIDLETRDKLAEKAISMKELTPRQQILWLKKACQDMVASGRHLAIPASTQPGAS